MKQIEHINAADNDGPARLSGKRAAFAEPRSNARPTELTYIGSSSRRQTRAAEEQHRHHKCALWHTMHAVR